MQPQTYQPPQTQHKPYGWASPSSPLHDVDPSAPNKTPQQVQPIPPAPPPYHAPQTNHPAHQRGYRCPRCNSNALPIGRAQISEAGWITFVLMLVFCFPLFFIGLLMTEEYRVCPVCYAKVG